MKGRASVLRVGGHEALPEELERQLTAACISRVALRHAVQPTVRGSWIGPDLRRAPGEARTYGGGHQIDSQDARDSAHFRSSSMTTFTEVRSCRRAEVHRSLISHARAMPSTTA